MKSFLTTDYTDRKPDLYPRELLLHRRRNRYAISARVLRHIQRLITRRVKRSFRRRTLRTARHTDTHRDRPNTFDTFTTQHRPQALSRRHRAFEIDTGQQQRKLFTTQPRRRVVITRNLFQRLRDLANHTI